jgi:osmoprotectant transport system substrate-binding protein
VIRKHNRRAAKAAFTIALGVAIILGGSAAAPAAQSKAAATPIIIGTKNFPEQYLLGQLYKQALEAKGFKVQYKENIASTELIDAALRSGRITMYPEYLGISLSVTFKRKILPKTAAGTYALAKRLYERRGQTVLRQTPFQDVDVIAVLRSTAQANGLKTLGDLTKVQDLSIAGFPEWETRWTGPIGSQYGVKGFEFVPLAGISAYTLLDQKKVEAADVFTTDPQLLSGKYTPLQDPKNMFGFQHVAPIVKKTLVTENGSKFTSTLNKVSSLLTVRAMAALNKAVAIDKKSPAKVAAAFLKANGLT